MEFVYHFSQFYFQISRKRQKHPAIECKINSFSLNKLLGKRKVIHNWHIVC